MRSYAITIETFDRRLRGQKNYIAQTLKNLAEVGVFDSPLLHSVQIVCGGEQEDFAEQVVEPALPVNSIAEYHAAPEQCTRQQNGMRAFAAGAATDADWVIKLEDDLDFIDDFLGSVDRWLDCYGGHASPNHPETYSPLFCLGASFETVSRSKYFEPNESILGPGESFPCVRAHLSQGAAMRHPVLGFWGAQALLLKRPVAAHLAAWLGPDPFLYDGKQQHRDRGHDLLLQVWGQHLHSSGFICTAPAFVQHIGEQSNIGNPFFQFPWPGRGWKFEVSRA